MTVTDLLHIKMHRQPCSVLTSLRNASMFGADRGGLADGGSAERAWLNAVNGRVRNTNLETFFETIGFNFNAQNSQKLNGMVTAIIKAAKSANERLPIAVEKMVMQVANSSHKSNSTMAKTVLRESRRSRKSVSEYLKEHSEIDSQFTTIFEAEEGIVYVSRLYL